MRALWVAAGVISLVLAVAGLVLPLLPTTPFLLLAAAAFARSSPRLHDWLLAHPLFGQVIRDWREAGAISRRAKRLAALSMAAAFGVSLALGVPGWALAVQAVALVAMGSWIWTRPER